MGNDNDDDDDDMEWVRRIFALSSWFTWPFCSHRRIRSFKLILFLQMWVYVLLCPFCCLFYFISSCVCSNQSLLVIKNYFLHCTSTEQSWFAIIFHEWKITQIKLFKSKCWFGIIFHELKITHAHQLFKEHNYFTRM